MLFRNSRSQESNASNGVQIRAKTKKLWPFEDNRTKLSENFAAAKPPTGTCATSQIQIPFLQLRIKLRNHLQVEKSQIQLAKCTISTCEIFTSCI